jgi:hypothetical protein
MEEGMKLIVDNEPRTVDIVKLLVTIMQVMPRGKRPESHPSLPGTAYVGLLENHVRPVFKAYLRKHAHPAKDDAALMEQLFQQSILTASEEGKITRIDRSGKVTLYSQGEWHTRPNYDTVLEKVSAAL